MKHTKRWLSVILTLALVLSLLPVLAAPQVSAATGYDRGYAGGMAGTGSIVAHGVDVSEHQGSGFNFQNLVNNGYTYVILRCGFVSRKDYCFEEYYAAAKAAGLNVGVYFYSYASTAAEASAEADLCLSYIAGKTFEYPVYFDFEDSSAGSVGGTNAYNICTAFLDKIAAAGYLAGLYGYAGWFDPNYGGWVPVSSICSRYECWIANYYDNTYTSNPRGGNYSTTYGMWQYTSTNYIGGVGPLDTNVCYKDYPSIVKTYGFNGYSAGKDPIGWLDSVTAVGPGKIKVRGWTLDEDEPTKSLTVHIYIGGGPGDPNGEGHVLTANVARDDVASLYPSAGNAHGFEAVISTGKSGNQEIIAYGLNVGSGGNALLNNSGCTVNIPADTEKPTISDIKVTNLTGQGYTVTATVSDNVGIKNVSMPTWTMEEQDDIIWKDGAISGNTVTLNVNFADHNFEYGTYATHIYAYDLAGNCEAHPVYIDVPPILANEPITGTVGEDSYFIANAGNRNFVLDVNGKSLDNNANVHLWRTLGYGGNQMWQFKKVGEEGYYSIINVNSGKALDVTDALTANGSNVAQYDPNSTAAQLWKPVDNGDGTYTFISKCSGKVLDLKDAKLANGQNIQIYDSNGTNAQKWYLIPADLAGPEITDIEFSEVTSEGFRVTCTVDDISGIQKVDFAVWTKKNGSDDLVWHPATVTGNKATYYVSISDHNTEPGDYDVHIYAYDGVGNSRSVNTNGGVTVPNKTGNAPVSGKLESGTYFIASSLNPNYVLDVAGVSMDNNANVHLWLTSGTNLNHMWQIRDADGDGYYNAVAVHSGKALDVTDANTANGSNVAQYGDNGTPAQLWKILPNDDGTYSFFNMCSDKALDLKDGKVANGQNIQIYESNGSAAQKWYLIPAKLSEDVNHIHTYLEESVTEPTCEEPGYTTHICENCGYSYTDNEVPALGHDYHYTDNGDDHTITCGNCDYNVTESHSYENGICVCGAEEIKPTEVTVKISHTVSFDADLQMNYRIKYDNIAAIVPNYVTDGAYLVVEKDRYPMGGGEKTVETVTLYPDLTSDTDRMLFSLTGIQSVEMGSELRAVLYFFDAEGNKYATAIDSYSVLAYAQLCYSSYTYAEKPELYTLLIDALNYGAAAQAAFDRRADEPVNAGMEAYQQYATTALSAELTDRRTYVDNDRSITAVTNIGFTVTFADKTELNAKLTIADGYSKEDITSVKVLNESGEEVATLTDFTELSDGRLQVTFTGIKSVNMRDMYYFVAYVGEQAASEEIGYSVEAYARSNINSSDAVLAALARTCMYYGDSAKACFG